MNHKYALALHTTTPQLGICLDNFLGDRRTRIWDLGRDLSSLFHQYLQEMIHPQTWQDLQFLAVAKGPGGFTGTRIGVVTARTLAQQLKIPLYGISTLKAIAHRQINYSSHNCFVAVQMNAQREQLFVAIYHVKEDGTWQTHLADSVMTPQRWQATLSNLKSPFQLVTAFSTIADTVTEILDLAHLQWKNQNNGQWSEVIPFYGQNPFETGQLDLIQP